MFQFVRQMLERPDAHKSAYVWGAVFAAHMSIAFFVWLVLFNIIGSAHEATKWAIYAYFFWEAAQFANKPTRTIFLDCVLDLFAWASICFGIYELWLNEALNALIYVSGAFSILLVGIVKRCKSV